MQDGILLREFEQNTIDPELMTHENHVRLAWLLLQGAPLTEAIGRYRQGLLQLTTRIGKPEKFHETITIALMMIIHDRCETHYPDYAAFAAANPDLFAGWKDVLLGYYPAETLFSDGARRRFRFPDPTPTH